MINYKVERYDLDTREFILSFNGEGETWLSYSTLRNERIKWSRDIFIAALTALALEKIFEHRRSLFSYINNSLKKK